ncbi:MAG: hypothetical protein ABIE22_00585 [archaeon]
MANTDLGLKIRSPKFYFVNLKEKFHLYSIRTPKKYKVGVKWLLVFILLSFWTIIVIKGLITGSVITGNVARDFEGSFLLQTTAGNLTLSQAQLIDLIFNHEFKIESAGIDYLITDLGELDKRRSIEEVRKILDENPSLAENFENLKNLYSDYWWLIVPGGSALVS